MAPKWVAFGNQKGGVGKTSLVLGCADALATAGGKVLVIDLDPQGSATTALGVEIFPDTLTAYDVLAANTTGALGQAIVSSAWNGIDVIPADESLAQLEGQSLTAAEHRLQVASLDSPELEAYGYVLIDLPPSLGRLTLNGLVASDYVVVVTVPEAFSTQAVGQFISTLADVAGHPAMNPRLSMVGIVVNAIDRRLGEHKFQLEQLQEAYGQDVLEPALPAWSAVKDMTSARRPPRLTGNRRGGAIADLFAQIAQKIQEA